MSEANEGEAVWPSMSVKKFADTIIGVIINERTSPTASAINKAFFSFPVSEPCGEGSVKNCRDNVLCACLPVGGDFRSI